MRCSTVQILHSVIKYGEPTEVISLALMAAPCMKEIVVAVESKEIKIPVDREEPITVRMCLLGRDNEARICSKCLQGKVVLRHAAHIQITFSNV